MAKVDQNARSLAVAACEARVKSRAEVSDSVRNVDVVDGEEGVPQFCCAYDPTYTRRCGKAVYPGCSFCHEHFMVDEVEL